MANFLFVYDQAAASVQQAHVQAFISSNKYISEWSLLFGGCYFLRSDQSLSQIRDSIASFVNPARFALSEIEVTASKTDGLLSDQIWKWLADTDDEAFAEAIKRRNEKHGLK